MGDPDKFEVDYGVFHGIGLGAAFKWATEEYMTYRSYTFVVTFLCFYASLEYNKPKTKKL